MKSEDEQFVYKADARKASSAAVSRKLSKIKISKCFYFLSKRSSSALSVHQSDFNWTEGLMLM